MFLQNYHLGKSLCLHCEHHLISKMTFRCEKCRYKFGVGVHKLLLLWTTIDLSGQVYNILMLCFNITIQKYGPFWPNLCILFFMTFYIRQVDAALNLCIKTVPCTLKENFSGAVSHIWYNFLFLCIHVSNFYALASLYYLPFSTYHWCLKDSSEVLVTTSLCYNCFHHDKVAYFGLNLLDMGKWGL
jgi:hypothetical protein